MIIVSGHVTIRAGGRDTFLEASREAMIAARLEPQCTAFIVAADPIEPDRVNVYEEWRTLEALLAFRGSGPDTGMTDLIVGANVHRHEVASTGPA